ncbi:EEP domain-containing protein [Legionella israelensis]|uniref:endonuclease/exonuclease/phosphatase family protein n=1 Tax=Legionella israelensis TaxID=454 RepID=UPI00118103B4|nr:endonuclease/exonuclease/phosphatase family protein [Legionella israelensis]QDP71795.1 EEP domain-containing protein [Legionella israelensis]
MPKESTSLSLITYNIHKGFGVGTVRFLLPKMRDAIANLKPDFVFLQEVQGEHVRRRKRIDAWPETSQTEYIAEKIWPHYVYAKNAVYQSGHHGNAILSKYPFDKSENINLSNIHRASRGILHSRLVWKDQMIHLLCVHLGLFKAERAEQCKTLMRRISEAVPESEPLLMAGDFNDWRTLLSKPLASELGIHEAFVAVEGQHARSFPAIRPALCIDRVYFRGMEVQEVACLQGKPWRLLSDHLPLYARFKLM